VIFKGRGVENKRFIPVQGWGYTDGVKKCPNGVKKSLKNPRLTPAAARMDPLRAGNPKISDLYPSRGGDTRMGSKSVQTGSKKV